MKERNKKGQFIKGHKPYKFWLGKKFSKAYKEKLSLSHLGQKGYWTGKKRINMAGNTYSLGCKHSEESRAKMGFPLEQNPAWKGGISFEPYAPSFNRQLKDRTRVRDNFICQLCGVPELECDKRLCVHHIDYDKKNCEESNLISLCRSCHTKTNHNRQYWQSYFIKLQREKICNP